MFSRRGSSNVIDVTRLAAFWEERANGTGYGGADVPALGDVLHISELEHEFVACLGVLGDSKATL